VLPNILSPVIVAAALGVGNVIVLEAGLSYLGAGVQPPHPSWGNIIRDGSVDVAGLWWMSVFPGLAIVGTVLACNLLGDALRDALDPRQLPTND
jgi:peptide/nickel transport system permease protein